LFTLFLQIIKEASSLPISIIFIGIGGGDSKFNTLRKLDADNVRGNIHRDIVQFVQFNKFNHLFDTDTTKLHFESEFLAEIPTQVVKYVRLRG